MSITVLRLGVDTLHASIGGAVRDDSAACLEGLKLQAQEQEKAQKLSLSGLDFAVQAQGAKPYRYQIRGDEASILLAGASKQGGAFVRLSALGLALYEPMDLYGLMAGVVEEHFGPGGPHKVSRIDVAADFQGFDMANLGDARFVSPAVYRPVLPSIENPRTYYFGKCPLQVRIYNKTVELKRSGKFWVRDLWAQHPGFDPDADVWRFEVEVHRTVLRQMGYHSPGSAVDNMVDILRHGLTKQASLRIPKGKSTDRWPVHPTWLDLERATGSHTTITRDALDTNVAQLSQVISAMTGYAVSAGARLHVTDFDRVWRILGDGVCTRLGSDAAYAAAVRARQVERIGKGDTA